MKTYLDLCTEFYDLDKPNVPEAEFNFYLDYAKKANGPILEPMCGTGRILLPLAEMGLEIEGFDASIHMLNALRTKAHSKNLTVNVWEQFAQEIKIKKEYALVIIPCGSLGLIIEDNKLKSVLENIYNQLCLGGKFVFEVETAKAIPKNIGIWTSKVTFRSQNEYIILGSLPLAAENNIITIICRYELIENNNLKKTEMEKMQFRMHDANEMENRLKGIGFSKISIIKAYAQDEKPDSEDEIIVFECTK